MSLEHILLGMLRTPATGYALRKEFDEGPRHFWSAELSQIYPALQGMEKRGWLTSRREPSPRGPERRVYCRTPVGTKILHEWLQSGPILGAERFAYLGQLIFHGELGRSADTIRFLTQLREELAAFHQLLVLAEEEDADRPRGEMDDHEFHDLLCVHFGVRSLAAKVAACDECIEMVKAREKELTTRPRSPNGKRDITKDRFLKKSIRARQSPRNVVFRAGKGG
jgi:DNA-binding PadR family transcriptional regulator